MSNPFGMLSPDEIRRALLMGAIVAQVKETRRHVEAQIESVVLSGRPGPRLDGWHVRCQWSTRRSRGGRLRDDGRWTHDCRGGA